MPRKSLPAPRATPLRPPARRGQSSTPAVRTSRKRARTLLEDDDLESLTADPPVPDSGVGAAEILKSMDPEKQLEVWQDFAVDHYEMVEQLPLELHRNYRLLRELDDGVILHAAKLQSTIREYIALRLHTNVKSTPPTIIPEEVPPLPSITLDGQIKDETATAHDPSKPGDDLPTPIPDGAGGQVVPPFSEEVDTANLAETSDNAPAQADVNMDKPAGTGEDAAEADADDEVVEEVVEAEKEDAMKSPVEARKAFPSVSPDRPEADALPPQAIHHADPTPEPKDNGYEAWKLLPEIARLAREMVKNGEEKVAVAQGAYNSIDRHIRALDSALSAQEASILLGLRPNTEPSAMVGEELNLVGDPGVIGEEGDLAIGVGGGGPTRKGRASRKGRRGAVAAQDTVPAPPLGEPPNIFDADPSEPRYCYCNQVSYGEMIGCDNDDCPIEWFHLSCAGLKLPPTGKWLCNMCKPNIGLGKGGAGTVAPLGGPVRKGGRASRGVKRGRASR